MLTVIVRAELRHRAFFDHSNIRESASCGPLHAPRCLSARSVDLCRAPRCRSPAGQRIVFNPALRHLRANHVGGLPWSNPERHVARMAQRFDLLANTCLNE